MTDFTPEQIEMLAEGRPLLEKDMGFPTFRFRLELAGFDPSDENVEAAAKAVRLRNRARRRQISLVGKILDIKVTAKLLGEWIELPRSTVQGIASGFKPERLTKKQKLRIGELAAWIRDECQKIVDESGFGL